MVRSIESTNFLIALRILLYYRMSENREKRRSEETMMLREQEKFNQV